MSLKWRFPASNHGERKGISSGDTEAFKKSPYQSFAREILQNSIDARKSDEEPVRVEFNIFEIPTANIPGYTDLKEAMRRCVEFWSHKKDYVEEYETMIEALNQPNIKCLRVSDFNTTGLIGVESTIQAENQFLALTKGTGVSEKTGIVAGGSKGMGKNAAFLMSSIRTVFYSTKTCKDINKNIGEFDGSIGVSELVSGYVDDEICDNRDYTQGTGYFSSDDLNSALNTLLNLESGYTIRETETGTDIYIIGFTNQNNWEKEVINSILDSFMATIVRGDLEIAFNGSTISKSNVADLVYDEDIISKSNKPNIISQYRLLKGGNDVQVFDIDTDYGSCDLYIMPLSKEEEHLSTHKCTMIRHPLMKIKDIFLGNAFRVSAMCVIGENVLGQKLRNIENPQHIDWEPKRIKNLSERKEIQRIIKEIEEEIRNKVIECLQLGDSNPIDPNGAGDFLPDENIGDSKNKSLANMTPSEEVTVSVEKENRFTTKNARNEDENGHGLVPDIGGSNDAEDGDVEHPNGENQGQGAGHHGGSETSQETPGDGIIIKRQRLSGVKYKVISTNKKEGELNVVFISPIDNDKCYLNLSLLDDNNKNQEVSILKMIANENEIICSDTSEFGPFKIRTNEKMILKVKTNIKGFFACEVKVICK